MEDNNEVSIKLEKQALIREEIINKGFDSIQFIEYLNQCKGPGGENINNWSLPDLKNAVKDFIYLNKNKSQSQNENNTENKIQEQVTPTKPLHKDQINNEIKNENKSDMPAPLAPKEKKITESVIDGILDIKNNLFVDNSKKLDQINYGLETPNSLECRPIDKTDLSSHEELYIKIGFPEKIDGGFFGRDSVSFTVTAIPMGFVVKRNYFDFEWLKDILIKLYSSNFIPSLPQMFMYQKKSNEDIFFKKCNRYLEKFMNYLITDPIIKNSQILYDFLCVEDQNVFKKKQKEYENTTPNNDIQNNQSINGKIDINITQENEKKYGLIKSYCYDHQKLFKQIHYNLSSIEEDFDSITKKLNESSLLWEKLINLNTKYHKDNNYEKEIYSQMKNMFNIIEKFFKKENDLLKMDIKEYFNFFSNNINNCELIFKKADEYKRIYSKEEKDLISLKNELFNKKNMGSSEDKNVDLSKLLPRNTESTLEMKKNYGYYLNRSINEFERMKSLDYELYKSKISKCYKYQIDIINQFHDEIKKIVSVVDEIGKKKNKNEIKEKKDEKNNNEINNGNKINEN